MSDRAVRLHRVIRAQPEKLYRAFTEAEALAKWLPPHGCTCTVHHLEPGRRVRYTDRFDDPNLPGVMEVTVTLKPVSCGTELAVVQAGIPDVIPLEMCYLGWQESLEQFAALVEPEIPG